MQDVYAVMDGVRKFILGGALPALKNVVFKVGQRPCTDGDTIYLPYPDAMGSADDLLLWQYTAEHELGHEDPVNGHPHWREAIKAHKRDATVMLIANLLSDHVQERNRTGTYAGRDRVLLQGRAVFLARQGTFPPSPLGALFQWDTAQRELWNPALVGLGLANPANNKRVGKIDALMPGGMAVLKNEADVVEAAIRLRPLWPDSESESEDEDADGDKSDKDGEVGKGGKKSAPTKPDAASDRIVGKPHDIAPGGAGKSSPAGVGGAMFTPRVPQYVKWGGHAGGALYRGTCRLTKGLAKSRLPAKLRSWLVGLRQIKMSTGYRSGRLDTNRLCDVLRARDDVFRRTESVVAVDASVLILVDASGSMHGEMYEQACLAAAMLTEALGAAKAEVRVECFTESRSEPYPLEHGVIKDWSERMVPATFALRCSQMDLCNNSDGESLLWAYHQIKQRRAAKKLILVISDGEPAAKGPHAGKGLGIGEFLRHAVTVVESDPTVRLAALGVCGYDPRTWYKNGQALVDDTADGIAGAMFPIAQSLWTK